MDTQRHVNDLRKIYIPNGTDLAGRGLIMHFERGLFSYAFATIYCPINSFGPKNALTTKMLWQCVQFVKESLPTRTTLMIGTDANGHVGTHNDEIIDNIDNHEELPSIGEYNPETENGNGT